MRLYLHPISHTKAWDAKYLVGQYSNARHQKPVALCLERPRPLNHYADPWKNNSRALKEALFECFQALALLIKAEDRSQLVLIRGAASLAHSST